MALVDDPGRCGLSRGAAFVASPARIVSSVVRTGQLYPHRGSSRSSEDTIAPSSPSPSHDHRRPVHVGRIGLSGGARGGGAGGRISQELEQSAGPGARTDVVAGAGSGGGPFAACDCGRACDCHRGCRYGGDCVPDRRSFRVSVGKGGIGWRGSWGRGQDLEQEQTEERERGLLVACDCGRGWDCDWGCRCDCDCACDRYRVRCTGGARSLPVGRDTVIRSHFVRAMLGRSFLIGGY